MAVEIQTEPAEVLKPRKPWLAALLSLLLPGLGQYYNGQFLKSAALYSVLGIFAATISWTPFWLSVRGALACFTAVLAHRAYVVIDAFLVAKRTTTFTLTRANRWYSYLIVITGMLLLLEVSPALFLSVYKRIHAAEMTGPSMEAGLLAGDRFVADPKFYEAANPKVGEIVIMHSPDKPGTLLVKRCVVVSGDTVQMKSEGLFINGKRVAGRRPGVPEVIFSDKSPRDRTIEIPPGKFFVLGDNADKSKDSRDWGVLGNEALAGKAKYIYWSSDLTRIGTEFP